MGQTSVSPAAGHGVLCVSLLRVTASPRGEGICLPRRGGESISVFGGETNSFLLLIPSPGSGVGGIGEWNQGISAFFVIRKPRNPPPSGFGLVDRSPVNTAVSQMSLASQQLRGWEAVGGDHSQVGVPAPAVNGVLCIAIGLRF